MLLSDLKSGLSFVGLETSAIVSVIVVVPYLNNLATQFATSLAQVGVSVISITDLPHALSGK